MIIDRYELDDATRRLLRIGFDPEVLHEDCSQDARHRPAAWIWRRAMHRPALERCMTSAHWPTELLGALNPDAGWTWDAKHSRGVDNVLHDAEEIFDLLAAASGAYGRPRGNMVVTLNLRSYEDKVSEIGGCDWWRARRGQALLQRSNIAAELLTALIDMLEWSRRAGIEIFTEQLSMVIAKDPDEPVATLTPTLHSDLYYGERESVLCSLLEPGFNPFGGTLLVPGIRMSDVQPHLPIDLAKLLELLPDEAMVKVESGDIMLHDGMIGPDGIAVMERGLPHISPDVAGQSSRIVFLMRQVSTARAQTPVA